MKKQLYFLGMIFCFTAFYGCRERTDQNPANQLFPEKSQTSESSEEFETETISETFEALENTSRELGFDEVDSSDDFLSLDSEAGVYKNKTDFFALEYPFLWNRIDNSLGSTVMFISPLTDSEDAFQENISVLVETVEPEYRDETLEAYVERSLVEFKELFLDFNLLENKKTTLDGKDAITLIYEMEKDGKYLKFEQIIARIPKKIFILTYAAETKNYETHIEDFRKTITSFRFQNSE